MMDKIIIKGYIGKKVYDDSKTYNNGFKVYSFYPNNEYRNLVELNQYKSISISGILPDLIDSKEYTITCSVDTKSKYKGSYKVNNVSCDRSGEIGRDETVNFLSNMKISSKVIGNIISVYPNIIDLIINNRVNEIDVSKINGIGQKRLDSIVEKVNENYRFFDIMTEYADMGLTMSMIKALYREFSNIETMRKAMDENPYRCLCSIIGIGFKTADSKILNKNESLKYSEFRMMECIKYLLGKNEEGGNTWISLSELHKLSMETTPECINHFVHSIKENKDIYLDVENKRVALTKTYQCETQITKMIFDFTKAKKHYDFDVSKYTKSTDGFDLSVKQQSILPLLKEHGICVLSGYAGVGKTTSIKAVVDMITDNGNSLTLLAPTGRASKVLANVTDVEASTIHRCLGRLSKKKNKEEKSEIDSDFVIVDEASMIDIWLMRNLLSVINKNRTTLLFVCDPAQLASVGCGNVISDVIESGIVPTVFLDEVFRYGEGGLSFVATEIRNGKKFLDTLDERRIINFGKNKDYSFIRCDKDETLNTVVNLYKSLIQKGLTINNLTVLSAYNKGELGTYNINNMIQNLVNPAIEEDRFTREIDGVKISFRVGDKVIQTQNDYKAKLYIENQSVGEWDIDIETEEGKYETSVFNGDDGIVTMIKDDIMVVDFNGELIKYEKSDLHKLLLGYVISVHKSQGSTFDNAILITPLSHKFFTKRNLLYVGVTRARNRVFHIGDIGTVNYGLKQSENIMRNTFLYDLLLEINK